MNLRRILAVTTATAVATLIISGTWLLVAETIRSAPRTAAAAAWISFVGAMLTTVAVLIIFGTLTAPRPTARRRPVVTPTEILPPVNDSTQRIPRYADKTEYIPRQRAHWLNGDGR